MAEDLVYICGEYISMVVDLTNCSDLIKRTLDDYFGNGWVVIIININSKTNSNNKPLSFGANYSLSDKVDMKISYFE